MIVFHRASLIIGTNYHMRVSTHQIYFYSKLSYLSNLRFQYYGNIYDYTKTLSSLSYNKGCMLI